MSEVEWRGRTVPVKIDKVRIFLLGLADNEAAIVQVRSRALFCSLRVSPGCPCVLRCDTLLLFRIWVTISRCMLLNRILLKAEFIEEFFCVEAKEIESDTLSENGGSEGLLRVRGGIWPSRWSSSVVLCLVSL